MIKNYRQLQLVALVLLVVVLAAMPVFAQSPNPITKVSIAATSDLALATFHVRLHSSKRIDAGLQLYVHRMPQNSWELVEAHKPDGSAKIFSITPDDVNDLTFATELPIGNYDGYRVILFRSDDDKSINYNDLVYDTSEDPARQQSLFLLKITSSETRLTSPRLTYAPMPFIEPDDLGTYTVEIPVKLAVPADYPVEGGGFWVLAKGSGGTAQQFLAMKDAQVMPDKHLEVTSTLILKTVKVGLWNVQFGVFRSSWGDPLQWIYPGLDFEAGGDAWEVKSDKFLPRLQVHDGKFMEIWSGVPGGLRPYNFYSDSRTATKIASFPRGGDYGNAICWTLQPEFDDPAYFTQLSKSGIKFIRVLFNPDRYEYEDLYRDAVDQVVQNIWQADLFPLIGPQDLPKGDTLTERIDKGNRVCKAMAQKYKGRAVWIEVCNEPHEFTTWDSWKPVAATYVKTIRTIDKDAFVVVPLEFYSKDGRGLAKNPFTTIRVDLYDAHAYVDAKNLGDLFGGVLKAHLPLILGEYGGGDSSYLHDMDIAFEKLQPAPLGIAAWAFTAKGQDGQPLVDDFNGSAITFNDNGQQIDDDYRKWLNGKSTQ